MQAFIQYDQESGVKSGGGDFLTEGGAYICEITSATYSKAATGTHGIEIEIKTDTGLKGRYIKVYYAKSDNTLVASGQSILNAMMGILGGNALTFSSTQRNGKDVNYVPELEGKAMGLFINKKLYSKSGGGDGYGFEIQTPFNPSTGQTLREMIEGKQAQTIERLTNSYADKDERHPPSQSSQGASNFSPAGPDVGDGPSF